MTKLRAGLLGILIAVAPLGARAQIFEAEVPEPVDAADGATSPSESLTDPVAPVIPAEGYGDLTLPDLQARPARDPDRVHVDVLGFHDGPLTLHIRDSDHGTLLTNRCTSPCQLDLRPGRYAFAVQAPGTGIRMADDQPVWISGSRVALQMSYDHRNGLRTLGWVFFSAAITAFGLSWIGGIFTALIIGAPIAAALLIPFLPLVALQDSARVQVVAIPD